MVELAFVDEPPRRVEVIRRAEVVVLGGGPAGIAAAAAAARHGAKTLLVERYGFLGGMGTAAGVTNFCGLHANVHGEIKQVVHGVADEILDRLRALDALNEPHSVLGKTAAQAYDNAAYKCVSDDVVLEAGAEILFHALAVGVTLDRPGHVTSLLVETKSGRGAIVGDVFIDCSGDADLAAWAGVPWEKGDDDGFLAYPTLMFRMGHVDTPRALKEGKPNVRKLLAEVEAKEGKSFPRHTAYINPQKHAGEWRANVTQLRHGDRAVDATNADEFSQAEIDGRKQVLLYYDFLRRHVPGFEAAYLLEIAPQIGVRETRRILGRHKLTREDVLSGRDFVDSIGVNGWPVEKHQRGGVEWTFIEGRGYHQVPFACTVPEGAENLLVAGRCASSTQDGQASLRVSGPCFSMGQAAGTAAAMATKAKTKVTETDVAALQAALVKDGVFLG